jgi:predicted nucleic acid-binding protein
VRLAETSWWVAWSLQGERQHDDALAVLRHLGRNERILTTNGIVGETWTFLRRTDGRRTAVGFLDQVDSLTEQPRLVVHHVSPEQERDALRWLRRRDEREYSFVDAISFRVMHHWGPGIRRQLHRAARFVEVRP